MNAILFFNRLHARLFGFVDAKLGDNLPGFLARLVFAATLYLYFLNSAMTKTGEGVLGFFMIQPSAWYQIAPQAVDAALGDIDAISFFPWGVLVFAGTYAEYLLPLLVVIGLFSRLAALGMIGFVTVQTLVDIFVHKVDAGTIGGLFDRFPDSVIADQRLFWVFVLSVIVLKGPGYLALDSLASNWLAGRTSPRSRNRSRAAAR